MLQLGDRDVEIPPQPILEAAQYLPLVLQRLRGGDVQLEGEHADRHLRLRDELGGVFLAGGCARLPGSLRSAHRGEADAFHNVADLAVVGVRYTRAVAPARAVVVVDV